MRLHLKLIRFSRTMQKYKLFDDKEHVGKDNGENIELSKPGSNDGVPDTHMEVRARSWG